MRLRAVAFTDCGMETGKRLEGLESLTRCPKGGLAQWVEAAWEQAEGLVFIGAVGIAVRAIAPRIVHKAKDPAVLVVDETGKFVIPILSGHIGGANAAAMEIARALGAVPVVTTATDLHGLFAVDTWAVSQGLAIANPEAIKNVSGKILAGKTVAIQSDFPLEGAFPSGVAEAAAGDVIISAKKQGRAALHLIPRCISLGIGCRKGAEEAAIEALYQELGIADAAICGVYSIDLKAGEAGLLAFCKRHGFPFQTFSAEELKTAEGSFTPSKFVQSVTGVDNVCERAAVLGGGTLQVPKQAQNGVTIAAAVREIRLKFGGCA